MNKKLVIDLGIKILNKFGYDNFIIYIKATKTKLNDYKDYILGFIFYKYLSEKIHFTANKILHDSEDETDYSDVDAYSLKQYYTLST